MDLYTKYRKKTGREHIRGEKIPEDFYHLVVHVWIRNRKGEYFISQRSANRPMFPRLDDVEDKWIVSLDGEDITEEKILGDISFQEQFFWQIIQVISFSKKCSCYLFGTN